MISNADNDTRGISTPIKISFCLFTYNQVEFVREALQSALSQDYSPTQIVVIDDGSSDGTAAIIKEEIDNYKGPHQIKVLLKNENKGFSDSVNSAIYEMADGDWLIFAAGDDVSLVNRATRIAALAMSDSAVTVIQSGLTRVNARGQELGELQPPELNLNATVKNSVLGAAAAYHKRTLTAFPRMAEKVIREDVVLTTRSLIYGHYARLDECLVKWRRHGNNMSGKFGRGFLENLVFMNGKFLNDHSIALTQQMLDTAHATLDGILGIEKSTWLLTQYCNQIRKNQRRSGFFFALSDGKDSFRRYVFQYPFYSVREISLLSVRYAREGARNFHSKVTTALMLFGKKFVD